MHITGAVTYRQLERERFATRLLDSQPIPAAHGVRTFTSHKKGRAMSRKSNEALLLDHLAAETRHDLPATLSTVHPDCTFVDTPLGLTFEGHRGASAHYEMWWTGFGARPDGGMLHWVDDGLVIGESTFVGRHDGSFAGIAPTGRDIALPFVVFVRFRDGLLAGERFVYDLNSLLAQLGQPAFMPRTGATR